MGWNVEYDDKRAQADLERLTARLVDLRPFWPRVIPIFVEWMSRQFETEGAFGGQPWAGLSAGYAETKARVYPGKGILIASGDLRDAASKPKRQVSPTELILTIDDSGYSHGGKENRAVLPYHQEGTDRMPARPLLFGDPLPAEAEAELVTAAEEYVTEITAGMGRGL